MYNSGGSSIDQNADRNVDNKGGAYVVSDENEDYLELD